MQEVLWNVKGGLFFIFLALTCTCFMYFKNIQVASLVKKVDFENLYQNKTRGSFTNPSVTGSLHQWFIKLSDLYPSQWFRIKKKHNMAYNGHIQNGTFVCMRLISSSIKIYVSCVFFYLSQNNTLLLLLTKVTNFFFNHAGCLATSACYSTFQRVHSGCFKNLVLLKFFRKIFFYWGWGMWRGKAFFVIAVKLIAYELELAF